MKRLLALLLSLLMLFSVSSAEGGIAAYLTPSGAQMVYLGDGISLEIPEGLEPLYDLMFTASYMSDVYLMRMKNGRAVASLSCTPMHEPRTAQELADRWAAIREGILQEAKITRDAFSIEKKYGFEVLHVSAGLEKDGLSMQAEAYAFCRDDQMMEIWTLCAEDDLPETASDRRDAQAFVNSLDFSEEVTRPFEGTPCRDAGGRFHLEVPEGAVVLTKASSEDEVNAARELVVSANPEGAARLFDEILLDVQEQDVMAVFTADGKGAVEIFAARQADFAGMTLEELDAVGAGLTAQLRERYGAAMLLSAGNRVTLGGYEQVLVSYWLRSGECNALMDLTACVALEDWLLEVDIFTMDGDLETRQLLHTMLGQKLVYTLE